MRIPRIYYPEPLKTGTCIELDQRNHHYIHTVLRLKPGTEVVLFNGQGGEYKAHIVAAGKQSKIDIIAFDPIERESALHTHLVQAISKGERMDYCVQKAVELGVSCISPINTRRCVAKIKADRLEKRMSHWQQIIISACEQTGRTRIPILNQPLDINDYLTSVNTDGGAFIFDTEADDKFTAALTQETRSSLTFLIGPEGGLAAEEFSAAEAAGFQRVQLGNTTLRTETVATVVLAIAQAMHGDYKTGH